MPILSWSARVLGSTATRITGAGNPSIRAKYGLFSSDIVSPVVTFFMPPIATISPADRRFNVFTFVGVHQHQASDALFRIFDRIVNVEPELTVPE
jgi:hypothetical protein